MENETKEYVRKHYDLLTEDGTIIRGAIYTEKPGFKYKELLEEKNKNKQGELRKLRETRDSLATFLRIPKKDLVIDEIKFRILTSRKIVAKYKDQIKSFKLTPAVVEESPEEGLLEIEIDFL